MSEIIPTIIAKDFKELQEKVRLVEPYVKTVQLDVMDGIFVSNETWPFVAPPSGAPQGTPSIFELNNLRSNLFLEAHLMIANPHRVLSEWLESRINRVILHWEALEKIHNHELLPYKTQVGSRFPVSNLAEEIHRRNKEFGVALNLETPIEVLDNFINEIDSVLLMSVNPGSGGQEFQAGVIPKVMALQAKYQNVKIAVDGGINLENVRALVEAGAKFLAVGSAIFGNENIGLAIRELQKLSE